MADESCSNANTSDRKKSVNQAIENKRSSNCSDGSKKRSLPLKVHVVSVEDVIVVAVTDMWTSYFCFKCGGITRLDCEDDDILECLECNTIQFVREAKVSIGAKFTVKGQREQLTEVQACNEMLAKIVGTEMPMRKENLLKCKPFSMYHNKGIIEYFTRY